MNEGITTMHETQPKVYLVARPQIDWEALRTYVDDVGGQAWSDRIGAASSTSAVGMRSTGCGISKRWSGMCIA